MKFIQTIAFLFIYNLSFAQASFVVDNFSKDYFGRIYIADTSEVFSKGSVSIYEKKTKKLLIKVNSEELALSLHDGKALANIKELPYGEQSLIIYDDFNFDGIKDLAIEDGQNSCYHGASFRIYLATKTGFVYNTAFSRLAQDYCGMFDVDYKTKTISTMVKSGCCWHEFSEFIVENNKPKAIRVAVDDQSDFPFSTLTLKEWNGKKMVSKSVRTIDLDQEEIKTVLSFTVDKNQKQIALYNINDRTLNYVVISKDTTVEFSYPIETVYQNPDFTFEKEKHTVSFKNKDASYTIYNDAGRIGIEISIAGKKTTWEGDINSRKGSLDDLLTTRLDNVIIH